MTTFLGVALFLYSITTRFLVSATTTSTFVAPYSSAIPSNRRPKVVFSSPLSSCRRQNANIIRPNSRGVVETKRCSASGDFFDEISDPSPGSLGNFERRGDDNNDDDEREMPATEEFDNFIPKLNIVTLCGRIGNDPNPRYFDDGKVVLNLSLAVKRKYHPLERKARNIKYGEEETDWFPLEMWGRDAEYATKYVTKGARVGITGSLQMNSWTDRNTGEERIRPKILVRHLDILESRAEAELRRSNQGQSYNRGGGGGGGSGNKRGGQGNYWSNEDEDDGGFSSAGTGGFFN